ncbi:MAG TPA: PH domain-containing protein [Candidatus Paceibacterota bacterium]|nr:PH domain-containing protein [Candidatus Paceibacterota bacterium]
MYLPLEEGEEIVTKVHRHWVFIALQVVYVVLLAVVPFALYFALTRTGIVVFTGIDTGAGLALGGLWLLVLWGFFWQFWTTYYMDIWVVTNRRIIDIDYERLFTHQISVIRLDRVQDVTTRIAGTWATFFKYGSVIVQSAGAQEEFVIDQISDPEGLRDAISRLMH